jgi:cell division protease FtsH
MTKEELEQKIMVLLGGRAAERLVFNHVSTGAADDLVRATDIAFNMVTRYGMDEQLGPVTYEEAPTAFLHDQGGALHEKRYSESTAKKIDDTVRHIIGGCFKHSMEILESNRDILDACAEELLKQERLDENCLRELTIGLNKSKSASKEAHARVPVSIVQ